MGLLLVAVAWLLLGTRYHGTGPAVTRCLWRYSLPTRYSVTGVTAKWCEAVGSGLEVTSWFSLWDNSLASLASWKINNNFRCTWKYLAKPRPLCSSLSLCRSGSEGRVGAKPEVSEDIPILVLRALSTKVVTVFCTGIKQITTGALAASASLNLTFWRLVSWLTG